MSTQLCSLGFVRVIIARCRAGHRHASILRNVQLHQHDTQQYNNNSSSGTPTGTVLSFLSTQHYFVLLYSEVSRFAVGTHHNNDDTIAKKGKTSRICLPVSDALCVGYFLVVQSVEVNK